MQAPHKLMIIKHQNIRWLLRASLPIVAFALAVLPIRAETSPSTGGNAPLAKFSPGKVWLDTAGKPINAHGGGVLFFEGTYYWYGEHKIPEKSEKDGADGGIHCYASKDLLNWEDKGLVLSVDYENPNSEIAYGCILERPKVVYNRRTQLFSAYFKLYPKGKGYGMGYLGVAVAKSPVGPFQYSHRVLSANSPKGTGDFYLYVDGKGDLYHLAVRKPDTALCLTKFSEDFMQPVGQTTALPGVPLKTEAPAVFFKDGKFFILGSGSSGWSPNEARLLMADSIDGPYEVLGNPASGVNPNNRMGKEKTFGGQSSFVIKVEGKKDAFIAMFDMWNPNHPIEGKYIWLPIEFEDGKPVIKWHDEWDLSLFKHD